MPARFWCLYSCEYGSPLKYRGPDGEDGEVEPVPPKEDEYDDFFKNNPIEHGDIVNFSRDDYRFTECYFYTNVEGQHKFTPNPDDSGSGYLTIPLEVTRHIPDFFKQYFHLIQEMPSVIVYATTKDLWIREQFKIPEKGPDTSHIVFNIIFDSDLIEGIYVDFGREGSRQGDDKGDNTRQCMQKSAK
eukprot:Platyproteum_vivax@DN1199_c0_g1_i2.p2